MHSYKKDINSYHLIMEAIKDFEGFYTINIAPILPELRKENKIADQWGTAMIIFLILAIAALIFTIVIPESWGGGTWTIILFVGAIVSIGYYTKKDNAYTDDFKERVIRQVVNYLNPALTYKPDGAMPEREYRQSGLFRRRYDYYYGEDSLEGVYKGVTFHCSELRTTYIGGRRNLELTIFKGLFFAAVVNPKYKGGTYVWIKDEEQFGESIADERYRLLAFPKVYDMKMGHELFDSNFFVCSTNPKEAREILDTDMMNRLLEFRKQLKRKVVFSVVMGRCYVGIPINEDLLEPGDPIGDKEEVKKYFFTILLMLSIINQLELSQLQ